VAVLNIEKAQAQYQITRADLLPKIGAATEANMPRTSASLSGTGFAVTSRAYSVGLDFSAFELKLFGRIQSLKDQALENFLAREVLGTEQKSYEIVRQRSSFGVTNDLDLRRAHATARKELIALRLAKAGNMLTLYKTLGGGWSQEEAHANVCQPLCPLRPAGEPPFP